MLNYIKNKKFTNKSRLETEKKYLSTQRSRTHGLASEAGFRGRPVGHWCNFTEKKVYEPSRGTVTAMKMKFWAEKISVGKKLPTQKNIYCKLRRL